MQTLRKIFEQIIGVLFPDKCIGCEKLNTLLCERCLIQIPKAENLPQSFIYPIFNYRSPIIKEIIWRLKYKNVRRLAPIMGHLLYEKIIDVLSDELSFSEKEPVLLVDIPLHKSRLRERGYNQSELLVREIIKCDPQGIFTYIPNILTRTRNTKPQARSEKRSTRLTNLKNAFACKKSELVKGRVIVIIDDVTTTGATIEEAYATLSRTKPRKIFAVTVAH
jgi:competence protein ComFC